MGLRSAGEFGECSSNSREKKPFLCRKKALLHEFSKTEEIEEFVVLDNNNKKLGRLTTFQIKEIFEDIGFNVDPTFSSKHFGEGAYITGTRMLYLLMIGFAKKLRENKIFTENDIQRVLNQAYNQSVVKKFGFETSSNVAPL